MSYRLDGITFHISSRCIGSGGAFRSVGGQGNRRVVSLPRLLGHPPYRKKKCLFLTLFFSPPVARLGRGLWGCCVFLCPVSGVPLIGAVARPRSAPSRLPLPALRAFWCPPARLRRFVMRRKAARGAPFFYTGGIVSGGSAFK